MTYPYQPVIWMHDHGGAAAAPLRWYMALWDELAWRQMAWDAQRKDAD